MNIVITGGAGFIGTNLVQRLLKETRVTEVRILDDFSTGLRREYDDSRVSIYEGDLRDASFVTRTVEGASRIIHLGALPSVPRSIADPRSTMEVNALGTLNVLEAARSTGVEHVISASSSSVYGANPMLPKTETLATLPMSPYAVSKMATESLTNAYSYCYGMKTLAFRFFNIFGPLQRADHTYAAVIPKFLDALKQRKPLTVFGDGNQSRDFTSVHAVVETLTTASLDLTAYPSPVNLAFGTRTTLNELVGLLREIHPEPIEVEHLAPRQGDVLHSQASTELLASLFPEAQNLSFSEALTEVYEWYLGQA